MKNVFYVYQLIDPRNNQVFYVGKGKGNRIDQHESEALKGVYSAKCKLIREIQSLGLNIKKQKVFHSGDEDEAYQFEADMIANIGLENLTNVLPGGTGGKAYTDYLFRRQVIKGKYTVYVVKQMIKTIKWFTGLVGTNNVNELSKYSYDIKWFDGKDRSISLPVGAVIKESFPSIIKEWGIERVEAFFKDNGIILEYAK